MTLRRRGEVIGPFLPNRLKRTAAPAALTGGQPVLRGRSRKGIVRQHVLCPFRPPKAGLFFHILRKTDGALVVRFIVTDAFRPHAGEHRDPRRSRQQSPQQNRQGMRENKSHQLVDRVDQQTPGGRGKGVQHQLQLRVGDQRHDRRRQPQKSSDTAQKG